MGSSTFGRIQHSGLSPTPSSVTTTRHLVLVSISSSNINTSMTLIPPGWTDNVTAQGTIHHNFFDRTNQRNPSADNLLHAHMYNNYMNGVTSYGHYVRGSTNARIENVYFRNTHDPVTVDAEG